MLAQARSAAVWGIDASPIQVEVNCGSGLPGMIVVGLPDVAVKESRDRVKTAVENSGYQFPFGRVTVNLAPADVRKAGPSFDLPIALGLLAASEQLSLAGLEACWMVGELALTGAVRPVKGVLSIALAARKAGVSALLVPLDNAREAGMVEGLRVYGVRNLREAADFLAGTQTLTAQIVDLSQELFTRQAGELDFADVKGQEHVKRALEVAVAGNHNVLMIGPPGSGKSMLAKRLPGIFPPLTLEEALEATRVHSVAGLLPSGQALLTQRVFRAPHHTISDVGLIGGGSHPSPGEVSLAHHGILFLDEMPEFRRGTLEVLRQPLEDRTVTISRAAGTVCFPAGFLLVGAMNPSPTGTRNGRSNPLETQRYLNRLSGPLLDRIDLHVEVPAVPQELLLKNGQAESSQVIAERVAAARARQRQRFNSKPDVGPRTNSQMNPREMRTYCALEEDSAELLRMAMNELQLSARAYDRILRVARTITDLAGREQIAQEDIAEAIQYRTLDRQLWAR